MTKPISKAAVRRLLPGPAVDERYGITSRTRHRWKNDPKLGFPDPAAIIHGREYYDAEKLDEFDQRMIRAAVEKRAA